MFGPDWETGCALCTGDVDEIAQPLLDHLHERSTAYAASSRAPIEKLEAYPAFARGVEQVKGTHGSLDLTALGRQESWERPKDRAERVEREGGSLPAVRSSRPRDPSRPACEATRTWHVERIAGQRHRTTGMPGQPRPRVQQGPALGRGVPPPPDAEGTRCSGVRRDVRVHLDLGLVPWIGPRPTVSTPLLPKGLRPRGVPMKILIADGNPIVLEGMRCVLEEEADFEVVATVERGSAVLPFIARTSPDVVLLDVALPGLDGFACLALLHERHPDVRAVLLSDGADAGDLVRAFSHGAAGLILKDIPKGEFASAIRQAVSGGYASAPRSAAVRRGRWTPRRIPGSAGLTPRETEIVRAVADGLSNREIARSLRIAEPTVKFHLSKVYRRLQVTNRTEVTHWAVATGIADGLRDSAPATV